MNLTIYQEEMTVPNEHNVLVNKHKGPKIIANYFKRVHNRGFLTPVIVTKEQ